MFSKVFPRLWISQSLRTRTRSTFATPVLTIAAMMKLRSIDIKSYTRTAWQQAWHTCDEFRGFVKLRDRVLESYLNSPTRFQKISEREDRSDLPAQTIQAQYMGKDFIVHRGCQVVKTADDMITLQQLFWNVRPATIIELGTLTGGSAIWMADMLRLMEIDCRIYSMDIDLSLIEERVKKLQPDNVTFLQGDSTAIEKTFTEEFLRDTPRPLVVFEDTHINVYSVLKHFSQFMKQGDYFVVEDLNPDLPSQLGYGRIYPNAPYEPAGMAGLNELKAFLSEHSQEFAVDSFYTDLFGYNATQNWHGYIRRM